METATATRPEDADCNVAGTKYTREGVQVGPSRHGLGVLSLRAFRRRELIGPIRGTIIEDPNYESDYCMEVGGRLALEPAAPFRYLNHSCRPNCRLLEPKARHADAPAGGPRLWLESLAEIAPGEQLTIDYAWPARSAIPCGCGCSECRGWIVAAEQRSRIGARATGRCATE